jgi:hypothetical protein
MSLGSLGRIVPIVSHVDTRCRVRAQGFGCCRTAMAGRVGDLVEGCNSQRMGLHQWSLSVEWSLSLMLPLRCCPSDAIEEPWMESDIGGGANRSRFWRKRRKIQPRVSSGRRVPSDLLWIAFLAAIVEATRRGRIMIIARRTSAKRSYKSRWEWSERSHPHLLSTRSYYAKSRE